MNRTFRLIAVMFLAALPFSLPAQNPDLLDELYDTFAKHCVVMDCTFSVESDGIPVKGKCEVEVQGTSYTMKGGGLEIFCNGESVWILDPESMEAVIEPVTNDSYSYMTNPALLFRDIDKMFSKAGSSALSDSGKRYRLTAREACGVASAVLDIDKNAVLKRAEFTLDDDSVMTIEVKSVKVQPMKESAAFRPGQMPSDWVVTDLR